MFICIQSLHEIHRTQQCTKQLLCSSLFPMEQVKLMILTMEHNSHLQHCSEVCLPEGAHPSHFVAAAATDISLWMVSINWNHLTPDPEEHEVPSLTGSPVVLVICKLAGSNLPKCGGSGKLVTQSLMAGLDPEGFPSPTESVIWSMRDNEKILTWKFSPHWNWTVLPILISRVTTPAFIYIYIYIVFQIETAFQMASDIKVSDVHKEINYCHAWELHSSSLEDPLTTLVALAYRQSSQPSKHLHTGFVSPGGYWSQCCIALADKQ